MFKDNKLRLLMTLAGFERLGADDEPGVSWIIPSAIAARELHETHDAIQKHRNNPVMHYGQEDPMSAEQMLRRKPSRRAAYDDDSEGDDIVADGEEDFLFPGGGGPTNTNRKSAALDELKQTRRKRRHSDNEDGLDDEIREARRKARLEADLEKRRKIKSAEFVIDSDGEDEEGDLMFFRKEDERRKAHAAKVLEALSVGRVEGGKDGSDRGNKKRKSDAGPESRGKKSKISAFYSDTEDDEQMDTRLSQCEHAHRTITTQAHQCPARTYLQGMGSWLPPLRTAENRDTFDQGNDSNEASSLPSSRAVSVSSEDESQDTPLSSPHIASSQEKVLKDTTANTIPLHDEEGTKDATDFDALWGGSDDENALPFPTAGPLKRGLTHKNAVASGNQDPTDDEDDENFSMTVPRSRQLRAVLEDSDDE